MTAKVPTTDMGRARLGITVAETFRRKRKITRTTRHMVSSRVNFTSATELRIVWDRSYRMSRDTAEGSWARNTGSSSRMASTTFTVFVPGWRWMARTMARASFRQPATLSFCTLSITRPSSPRRTGEPFR